jgi:hypothetical protein
MIDAELAALVFDSATEELSGVRSTELSRQMTFRTQKVEIELELIPGAGRRIVGQLVPPQEAEITLHHQDGTFLARSDGLGRFTFTDAPQGSVRLSCRLEDAGSGSVVQTEWMLI